MGTGHAVAHVVTRRPVTAMA